MATRNDPNQPVDQDWLNDFAWRIHELIGEFDAWDYVGTKIKEYATEEHERTEESRAAADEKARELSRTDDYDEGLELLGEPMGVSPLFLDKEKASLAEKYATLAAIYDHCHDDIEERCQEKAPLADPWADDTDATWPGNNWKESHPYLMLKDHRVPGLQNKHRKTLESFFDKVSTDMEERQPASELKEVESGSKKRGRQPTKRDKLWKVHNDEKAKDADISDERIVAIYHQRYPKKPRATVKQLQGLRHDRTQRKRNQNHE